MTFGGSLNKDGTKYYQIINASNKTVEFLESLKQYLTDDEKKTINETIEIITNHVNKLSEGKILDE